MEAPSYYHGPENIKDGRTEHVPHGTKVHSLVLGCWADSEISDCRQVLRLRTWFESQHVLLQSFDKPEGLGWSCLCWIACKSDEWLKRSHPPCLCTSVPRSVSSFPFPAISAYNYILIQSVAMPTELLPKIMTEQGHVFMVIRNVYLLDLYFGGGFTPPDRRGNRSARMEPRKFYRSHL